MAVSTLPSSQAPNAQAIAKGDFNGDGIEDIAVIDEPICNTCSGTTVKVFLGTGHGYFLAPAVYQVPVLWGAIAVGDVNGDGKLDIVVTRNAELINQAEGKKYSTPDLSVLTNKGDGTFEAAKSYTLLGAPATTTTSTTAYLMDVNHDGKLDLVGDWGTALGKGNGEFEKPIALPSSVQGIVAIAPGDFNGSVDLAVATYNGGSSSPSNLYVLSSDGNGSFTVSSKKSISYVESMTTADLNGDGFSDILYVTNTSVNNVNQPSLIVEMSQGNGAFSTVTYPLPPSDYLTSVILTGDFNRDGNTDVALLGVYPNGGDVALLRGTRDGALNKTPEYYQGGMGSAVVLDINGDGAPDIAGTNTIGIARLLNTGLK